MDRPAATQLAAAVAREDDEFPSVNGPRSVVDVVLNAYVSSGTTGSRRVVTSTKVDVLQAVSDLIVPDVNGEERLATLEDLELAAAWTDAFALEAFGAGVVRAADPRYVELSGTISSGRLSWWIVDGEVVSMAGHAPAVETMGEVVTRIGPVYTPPTARRHGYGAAVTAAVSRRLLDGGSRVMLFADEANPTSNGVYRSLGYEVVDLFVRSTFASPD
jgi:predicted GNAT family acetyltransferase